MAGSEDVRVRALRRGSLKLALLAAASAALLCPVATVLADSWNPTLDGYGRAGSGQGTGALDLMVPLYQDGSTLLLANALGGLDSDSARAASFGLVLRHRFADGFILGGYAYGDFQRSANGEAFPQVVAGLELKTADWDLHVTGYAPLGGLHTLSRVDPVAGDAGMIGPGQLIIDGNQLLIQHLVDATPGQDGLLVQEAALYGGEGSIGYRLPLDAALGHNIDANLYLGGYAFGRDGFDSFIGPQARFELQVHDLAFMGDGSRLTASLETSWDDPRGLQGAGLLRVRIPLGSLFGSNERHETDRLERRMVDPVQRQLIALTDTRSEVLAAPEVAPMMGFTETVRDSETDRTIALVYFASGTASTTAGTAADPTSLADAVGSKGITGNAATDALIVVSGEDGSITGHFDLAGNQILLGGGSTLQVTGNTSNEVLTFNPATFDPAASRPTIVHDNTLDTAALGATGVDHVKLVGLDITMGMKSADANLHYFGVGLTDSSHDILRDVTISGGDIGFLLDAELAAVDDTLIEDIDVSGAGIGLYVFSGGAGTSRVSNLTVNRGTFDSLALNGGVAARAVLTAASGMQTSNTLALNDITVTNTEWGGSFDKVAGLSIDGWTGTGVNSSSSGSVGLLVSGGSGLQLRDFSISAYRAGVSIQNNGTGNVIDGSTRGSIFDIGAAAALGTTGLFISKSDVSVETVNISGVGSLGSNMDFALQVNGAANVRLSFIAIDGQNSGGDNVTDSAVFLSGAAATDDITIQAGSDNNTATNVGGLCFQVLGGATVTGSMNFTAPVASCP